MPRLTNGCNEQKAAVNVRRKMKSKSFRHSDHNRMVSRRVRRQSDSKRSCKGLFKIPQLDPNATVENISHDEIDRLKTCMHHSSAASVIIVNIRKSNTLL